MHIRTIALTYAILGVAGCEVANPLAFTTDATSDAVALDAARPDIGTPDVGAGDARADAGTIDASDATIGLDVPRLDVGMTNDVTDMADASATTDTGSDASDGSMGADVSTDSGPLVSRIFVNGVHNATSVRIDWTINGQAASLAALCSSLNVQLVRVNYGTDVETDFPCAAGTAELVVPAGVRTFNVSVRRSLCVPGDSDCRTGDDLNTLGPLVVNVPANGNKPRLQADFLSSEFVATRSAVRIEFAIDGVIDGDQKAALCASTGIATFRVTAILPTEDPVTFTFACIDRARRFSFPHRSYLMEVRAHATDGRSLALRSLTGTVALGEVVNRRAAFLSSEL